ncbi:GGDEF domain-containing protein [Amphritea balenae]|uniref:GGDEF domain-containing protein n=1 Tax=Amphritea balenae TaxID=452629 RepID=UPI001475AD2B|nr:GGDEF domain-containing protein [Amphritea balenae]GGK83317.1 GGDEF domain-containing protein [Amphritea balenae]
MLQYNLLKTLKLLLPALALALLSPLFYGWLQEFDYALLKLLGHLPTLLAVISLLLCISFNQGRLLLATVNLLLLYLVIQHQLQSSLNIPSNFVLFSLLSLLFPALQILISFLPERGLSMRWLARRLPIIVAGYLFCWLAAVNNLLSDWISSLPVGLIQLAFENWLISQWAAFVFLLAGLAGSLILYFRGTLADAALLTASLGCAIMISLFNLPYISLTAVSVCLLLILFTILFNSYSMAFIDELTQLPGRRALENTLSSAGRRYTLAMVDVDHFKKFNDTYGHDVGDQVLRMVASQMKKAAKGASVYRYGGEEFTLVFRGMDEATALPIADKVRQAIADYPMRIRDKDRPDDEKQGRKKRKKRGPTKDTEQVCISIGLCQKTDQHKDSQMVIKQADEALYMAKQQGRNRCIASHTKSPRKPKVTATA